MSEENDVFEPPAKKRSIDEVYPASEIGTEAWTCICCHEPFPPFEAAYTLVTNCIHKLCLPCFEREHQRGHFKCDMCNKPWEMTWVSLPYKRTEDPSCGIFMVPLYAKRLPANSAQHCAFLGPDGRYDPGPIDKLAPSYRDTLLQHFPWLIKRRSPDKVFESIRDENKPHRTELFPLSDEEFVILIFFKEPAHRINLTRTYYNAVYMNIFKPREYIKIVRGGGFEITEVMKRKSKAVSMRAVVAISEVIAKNGFSTGL
jgi:hypothetical protein